MKRLPEFLKQNKTENYGIINFEEDFIMDKIVIAGEFELTNDADCIQLTENGVLTISDSLSEVTIKKLINSKTYPCDTNYEFLVAGEHGEDGARETGENGGNGSGGRKVTIKILELEGNVHIKASGGRGGFGGSGKSGINGGTGGRGGDGGDGAVIDFYYGRKEEDCESQAYVYSVDGGSGGRGGLGGICTGGVGMGGLPGKSGEPGAKFGDGGDGGQDGNDGIVTIHHPDGSITENSPMKKPEYAVKPKSITGVRILDLSNEEDYQIFLDSHGGEENLQKYPHLWKAVLNTKQNLLEAKISSSKLNESNIRVEGEITDAVPIGVGSKSICSDIKANAGSERYDFYKINIKLDSCFANSSTVCPDEAASDDDVINPVACLVSVEVKDEDTGTIIYKTSMFCDEEPSDIIEDIDTGEFIYDDIKYKNLKIAANVTYELNNGEVLPTMPKEIEHWNIEDKLLNFINKITVKSPHWHDGKTQGTIMFLYGRSPSSSSDYKDADYYGSYYDKNKCNNNVLRTIMPISGEMEFRNIGGIEVKNVTLESYGEKPGNYSRSYMMYKFNNNADTIAEQRPDIDIDKLAGAIDEEGGFIYDSASNTATFDLKTKPTSNGLCEYDWECNILDAYLNYSDHTCSLRGCFVINIENSSKVGPKAIYDIHISSTEYLPDNHKYYESEVHEQTVYIPKICIYWGCYSKETLIRTSGGELKRADEIEVKDRLLGFGGKTLTVETVLSGDDNEIYQIKTIDGRQISVSGGHAMLLYDETPIGRRIPAAKLKKGDKLMTIDGFSEITDINVKAYDGKVYNFIFEGETTPNYLEADGFWSGDFYAQNLGEKKPVNLSEEVKAVIEDMKKFADAV